MLRRPTNKSDEMRSDPFWEYGSFGLTGCHDKNLLSPRNLEKLHNGRLAFVQGGKDGFKLLLVTRKVEAKIVNSSVELKWKPIKPLKYIKAPTIISNKKDTDFLYLQKYFLNNKRSTLEGKFASAFRARTNPLEVEDAIKIIKDFGEYYSKTPSSFKISKYWEALPYAPPKIDTTRRDTYRRLKGIIKNKC